MENKEIIHRSCDVLSTDTLKLYEKYFKEFKKDHRRLVEEDKEYVFHALKRYGMWVDNYEGSLLARRETEKRKNAETENPLDVTVNDLAEKKQDDKEVRDAIRSILAINGWYECLLWTRSRKPTRRERRELFNKFIRGYYYNKDVYTAVSNAIRRLQLV